MLELICMIPEEIGWSLVGFTAACCLFMMVKLGKVFVEMWQERHEDEEDEVAEYSCDC